MCLGVSRESLLSFQASPNLVKNLPFDTWCVLRELGINKRTRRGCRGGKSTKRARAMKKFLLVGLVSTRSIRNKTLILQDLIINERYDILTLTETWLSGNGDADLQQACPPGYSSYHLPRKTGRGGGVAIIHRVTIAVSPSPIRGLTTTTFEIMSVLLTTNSTSIRIILLYRPPQSNQTTFLCEFGKLLEAVCSKSGRFIILGDFNLHVDNISDTSAARFTSLAESFGLTQHVRDPTHIGGHILDLVLTRTSDNLIGDCMVDSLISDHFVVTTVLKAHRPLLKMNPVDYRPIKKIDMDSFKYDLCETPFVCQPDDTAEGLLVQFRESTLLVLNSHAPLKKRVFLGRRENPWLSEEIMKARRVRRRAERKWRSSRLEINRQLLMSAHKTLPKLITTTKTNYIRGKIEDSTREGKSLHKIVEQYISPRAEARLPRHDSVLKLATSFGDHFLNKVAGIRAGMENLSQFPDDPSSTPSVPLFSTFQQVTAGEVECLIQQSPTKSCAFDPVPTSLLKGARDILVPSLAKLMNASLSSGIVPNDLKSALVTPLLKKVSLDPNNLDNYRPISNLPFLSKLLERLVLKQLVCHLQENGLLPPVQSAYRKSHSTETALLCIFEDLLTAIDNGEGCMLTLLDMSAAFDTVDHQILLSRLRYRYGISGTVHDWFRSYLYDRSQSVRIRNVNSPPMKLQFGVPQGSVLGPVLFILYTAPLHDVVISYGIRDHYYADDTQCYTKFKIDPDGHSQNETLSIMEKCVNQIDLWLGANKLKNNPGKVEVLYLSSSNKKPQPLSINIGGSIVDPSLTARNLGVVFDNHLTMNQQVSEIVKKGFYQLQRISRIRRYLDKDCCNILVCSLVLPHLDYANSLLYGLPDSSIKRLQKIQNCAARLITRTKRRAQSSRTLRKKLHWLPVESRITYKIASLAFKCVHRIAPDYLNNLVKPYQPTRQLRSSDSCLLSVPNRRKKYGMRSFSFSAPTIWNSLPKDLRQCNDGKAFHKKLKTHLFKIAYDTQ